MRSDSWHMTKDIIFRRSFHQCQVSKFTVLLIIQGYKINIHPNSFSLVGLLESLFDAWTRSAVWLNITKWKRNIWHIKEKFWLFLVFFPLSLLDIVLPKQRRIYQQVFSTISLKHFKDSQNILKYWSSYTFQKERKKVAFPWNCIITVSGSAGHVIAVKVRCLMGSLFQHSFLWLFAKYSWHVEPGRFLPCLRKNISLNIDLFL